MEKSLIEQIEQLITQYPIAPFVAPHTGGLKSSGRGFFVGVCPFHASEKSKKNFWVNANSGTCGCFVPGCKAYCNKSKDPTTKPLDIINFHALLNNITLKEAVTQLAKKVR